MEARRNSRNFCRFTPKSYSYYNRMPSTGTQLRNALKSNSSRRRSIVCSPLPPSSSSQQFISQAKPHIHQATQTDMSFGLIVERIELKETADNIYGQLLSMMSQATANPSTSESDHHIWSYHNNFVILVRPNSIEYMQQSSGSSSSPGFVEEMLVEEDMDFSNGGSIGVYQEQHNSSNDSKSNIGEDQEQHNSSNDSNSNIGEDQEQHNSSNNSNSNIGEDQEQHNSSNDSYSNIGVYQEKHNSSNDSNSNIGEDQEQRNSSNDSNSNIGEDQEQHNSANDSNSNIGEDQEHHNSANDSNSNIGEDQEQHNSSNDSNSNIRVLRSRRVSRQTTNDIEPVPDGDLVPIGYGHAKVPRRLLKLIKWKSYTTTTRKLLRAIFPRRVLATHSLSGKRSPAFLHRPAKKILNPLIVEDIVTTVSTRFGVPKKWVRQIITTKCSDEAKACRNRQRRRQLLRQARNNEENLQPSTSSSD